MQKVKRGPPYDEDPGCKYIVIEDPWPGNATGKARDDRYYNLLCAWVRFMLDKKHEAECVYAVNTRNEVIVQLPQEVDIVPILGSHPWRTFLSRGDQRDAHRVSYVFAYNYRIKGDPAKHNWQEIYSTVSGDPPPHINFPVKFPYPHVNWASPRGKNCGDISLPLPPVRQPTPIPDTSLFTPYQHPTQLSATTVNNAVAREQTVQEAQPGETRPQVQDQKQSLAPPKLGKADPYEQEIYALRSLSRDSELDIDIKPVVKSEHLKQEEGSRVPSEAFRAAFAELQRARAAGHAPSEPQPQTEHSMGHEDVKPKREEVPVSSGPSGEFVSVFNQLRGGQVSVEESPRVKVERTDGPPPPSEAFLSAFKQLRGTENGVNSVSTPQAGNIIVKAEQRQSAQGSSGNATMKLEPQLGSSRHIGDVLKMKSGLATRHLSSKTQDPVDPRAALHVNAPVNPPKRVKEEDRKVPAKRFKTEDFF